MYNFKDERARRLRLRARLLYREEAADASAAGQDRSGLFESFFISWMTGKGPSW